MDEVRISRQASQPTTPRDQRRMAGLVAQYIHELSDRHAAVRRDARPDRTPVRELEGA